MMKCVFRSKHVKFRLCEFFFHTMSIMFMKFFFSFLFLRCACQIDQCWTNFMPNLHFITNFLFLSVTAR